MCPCAWIHVHVLELGGSEICNYHDIYHDSEYYHDSQTKTWNQVLPRTTLRALLQLFVKIDLTRNIPHVFTCFFMWLRECERVQARTHMHAYTYARACI